MHVWIMTILKLKNQQYSTSIILFIVCCCTSHTFCCRGLQCREPYYLYGHSPFFFPRSLCSMLLRMIKHRSFCSMLFRMIKHRAVWHTVWQFCDVCPQINCLSPEKENCEGRCFLWSRCFRFFPLPLYVSASIFWPLFQRADWWGMRVMHPPHQCL